MSAAVLSKRPGDFAVTNNPDSVGEPENFGRCVACGEVYPVQIDEDDRLRPIGVEKGCACGNDEFVPYAGSDVEHEP